MDNRLKELEQQRRKIKLTYFTAFGGLILFCMLFLGPILGFDFPVLVSVTGFLTAYSFLPKIFKQQAEYNRLYKLTIIDIALKDILDGLEYTPWDEHFEDYKYKYKVINSDVNTSDYVKGQYKGIIIEQVDANYIVFDSDDDTHIIFQGKWIMFSFNKNFKNKVMCVGKNYDRQALNSNNPCINKIELESIKFNEAFSTYTDGNGHDVFYLLSPQMMEKLMELSHKYYNAILIAFTDNKMHILLNDGFNTFEPNWDKRINVNNEIAKVQNEMKETLSIIDDLNLDEKLFKRG